MNLSCVLNEVCSKRKLTEIRAQWKDPTFAKSLKGKLKSPFKEKKNEKNSQMLKLSLKAENWNEDSANSLCVSLLSKLKLKRGNYLKRVNVLIT